ncbi:putative membrane protein [Shigella boydii 965-58]|nr:putative membrane protein [Shigella boydii 965-58]
MIGASLGITTGPGAVATGIIGGIVFGAAGYFGADWVADYIDEN